MMDLAAPPSASLERTPESGRFRPHTFFDPRLWSQSIYTTHVVIPATSPGQIRLHVKNLLEPEGFGHAHGDPSSIRPSRVLVEDGPVRGVLVMERDLRFDRVRSLGRQNRLIAAAVCGFAVAASVAVWSQVTTGFVASSTATILGIAVPAGLATIALTFIGDASYWSDLVVVRYESDSPTQKAASDPAALRSTYKVDVAIGRAVTRNWESRSMKGRAVVRVLPSSSLEGIRSRLIEVLKASAKRAQDVPLLT